MTSVLLVENHEAVASMIARYLTVRGNVEVRAVVPTAEAALEQLAVLQVDLALIDISLPRMSGIELVGVLQERQPPLRCLILSGYDHPPYVQRALAAGACGYVIKGDPAELLEGIEVVLQGGTYLSPALRTMPRNWLGDGDRPGASGR